MVAQKYMNLEIHRAVTEKDKKSCLDLRIKIFVEEQGYPLTTQTEDKHQDSCQWLATCELSGSKEKVPVGTIRLVTGETGAAQLGRLGIVSDARGMALGRKLVDVFLQEAKRLGYTSAFLEGQVDKRGFYEKVGFVVEKGDEEPYPVYGAPHYKMWNRFIQ